MSKGHIDGQNTWYAMADGFDTRQMQSKSHDKTTDLLHCATERQGHSKLVGFKHCCVCVYCCAQGYTLRTAHTWYPE